MRTSISYPLRMIGSGALAAAFALVSGCGTNLKTTSGATLTASARGAVSGSVHGGQQPIANSTIQLYAAGTTGDGSAAVPLLQGTPVLTDVNGGFTITGLYSCPSQSTPVFLLATGGNPGLGAGATNPNIALMSALGPCGNLTSSTFIAVDEVSTVAAAYSLSPFMNNYTSVGSTSNDAASLATAFALVNQYVDTATGLGPGPALAAGHTAPIAALYTLADALAACVNSVGGSAGDGSACGRLFDAATPGGGPAPANTLDAILNIAKNPTRNVSDILLLSGAIVPFSPSLTTAPADWTLPILPNLTLTAAFGTVDTNGSANGTITLGDPAPNGGLVITVISSDTSHVTVTSTSSVAPGQTTATFSFYGVATGPATLTASAPGYASGALLMIAYPAPADPLHGSLIVSQAIYPANTPITQSLTFWVPAPNIDPSSVVASETDAQGNLVSVLGTMHDDGLSGDAAAGDKVFSLSFPVIDSSSTTHYYAASFRSATTGTTYWAGAQPVSTRSVEVSTVSDETSYAQNLQQSIQLLKSATSAYTSLMANTATLDQGALDDFTSEMVSVVGNLQQLKSYDTSNSALSHFRTSGAMPRGTAPGPIPGFWIGVADFFGFGNMASNYNKTEPEEQAFLSDSFEPDDPAVADIMAYYNANVQFLACDLSDKACREVVVSQWAGVSSGTYAAASKDALNGVAAEAGGVATDVTGESISSVYDLSPVSKMLIDQADGQTDSYFVDAMTSTSGSQLIVLGGLSFGQTTDLPAGSHDMIITDTQVHSVTTGITPPPNGVVLLKGGGTSGPYSAPSIWPMQGQNPQKTSDSPYLGPQSLPTSPKWKISTGAPVVGDLAVSQEGVLYFASDALYAINPDGTAFAAKVPLGSAATGPSVDDVNGYVYLATNNPDGTFTVSRYAKNLSSVSTLIVPNSYSGHISPLILSNGTLYFTAGRFPATVYSVGPSTWSSPLCPGEGSPQPASIDNAPAVGTDGSVFVMCEAPVTIETAPSGLYKLDPSNGQVLASSLYTRTATEPTVDSKSHVHAGYQVFGGAAYCGAYDEWDSSLNLVTVPHGPPCSEYTSGRATVMPDGNSTVRRGYTYGTDTTLVAIGQYNWTIEGYQATPSYLTAVTMDALGRLYVGTSTGVEQLSPKDGSVVWNYVLQEQVTTQPAISNTQNMYIGTANGNIYAFAP